MAVSDIENLTVLVKYIEWFELNGCREVESRFDSVANAVDSTGYRGVWELLNKRFPDNVSIPGITMNLALFALLCDADKFDTFSGDSKLKTNVTLHGMLGLTKKEASRIYAFKESILSKIEGK